MVRDLGVVRSGFCELFIRRRQQQIKVARISQGSLSGKPAKPGCLPEVGRAPPIVRLSCHRMSPSDSSLSLETTANPCGEMPAFGSLRCRRVLSADGSWCLDGQTNPGVPAKGGPTENRDREAFSNQTN